MTRRFPDLKRLHMVNNEALVSYVPKARQMAFRQHLVSLGLISGVSDLFLPAPRYMYGSVYGGLYLELKRPNTKDLQKVISDNQDGWMREVMDDYACFVVSSYDGAKDAIISYLANPHPQEVIDEFNRIRKSNRGLAPEGE